MHSNFYCCCTYQAYNVFSINDPVVISQIFRAFSSSKQPNQFRYVYSSENRRKLFVLTSCRHKNQNDISRFTRNSQSSCISIPVTRNVSKNIFRKNVIKRICFICNFMKILYLHFESLGVIPDIKIMVRLEQLRLAQMAY